MSHSPGPQTDTGRTAGMPEGDVYVFPASFGQQRLWFLDQLQSGSPLYNIPIAIRLRGQLDGAALRESINEIVRRHESLRTTFACIKGEPVQVIAPALTVPVRVQDLRALPEPKREAEVHRQTTEEARRPFDLAEGPLLRATVLQLEERHHVLLLTVHHIVSDGWSVDVFRRELAALYEAFSAGKPSPLPELPVQYADFVVWQRQQLQGERLEAQLAYWREQLRDAPLVTEFPPDRPRPAAQTFQGALYHFTLPEALTTALLDLARREECTLFMVLLAGLNLLLHQYTGQTDVLIGTAIANRSRSEIEGLIGFFANTLVLRTDMSGSPTFRELLGRVRKMTLEAYMYQDLPFDVLVDQLAVRRDPSRSPLFQVAFTFGDGPSATMELPGLTEVSSRLESGYGMSKFDLSLFMARTGAALDGWIEYNLDLFDLATIMRLSSDFEALLAACSSDPESRIGMVSVPSVKDAIADALQISVSRVGRVSPLTTTQRDLYADYVIDPEDTTYSLGLSVDLGTELDWQVWEAAVSAVLEHEDVARTRFFADGSRILQFVDTGLCVDFEFIELRQSDVYADLDGVVESRVRVAHNLQTGPLLHNILVRGQDGRFIAILAAPHILLDGYSAKLLFERVGAAYDALVRGEDLRLRSSTSFFDFVGESLARFDVEATQEYWSSHLSTVAPFELRAGPGEGRRSQERTAVIHGGHLEEIRAYCKVNGCSIAAYFRALYAAMLERWFRPEEDFAVFEVVDGRTTESSETLGCFYHVVPILFPRRLFQTGASVEALIAYVTGYRRRLGQQQYISVLLQRDMLGHEGLSAFYNFYGFAVSRVRGSEATIRAHDSFPDREVHLIVVDTGEAVELTLHFSEACFMDVSFLDRLVSVSAQVVGGAMHLCQLDLLLPVERQRLLVEWNDTGREYPRDRCIPQFLEAHAERTPDAVAVILEDKELTYGELNRRANRLAHYLQGLGVGPEVLVGVCMQRSLEMVIALLGVLKAGAAYVPLDPTYPQERLAYMLEDSRPSVLLTQQHLSGALPVKEARVVCVDTRWPSIGRESEANPACRVVDDSLAYVIYTSGSTGKPKGAMNTHGGIWNRLLWMQEAYRLTAADRVMQKTPLSFDVSVWELLWPLLAGACLVLARPGGHKDGRYLVELIAEQGITTVHFVPPMLQVFLEEDGVENCDSLRRVICSGEALPVSLQERFFARLGAELHNLYGPTEAAVDVTYWACEREGTRKAVPIGRPIANTQIYLLDSAMRPVPVGLPGDLYIGGAGLARGYLNRPELTGEKFVPHPFSDRPGARLYRTGDQARYLPDGNIEFLGRTDQQVKIRGFRIELGEVEAALKQHSAVRNVVVVARQDDGHGGRLVAYLVPANRDAPTASELRAYLGEKLPEHMIPSAFVALEHLPLTPNGKIDRRALPMPEEVGCHVTGSLVAPRNATEFRLVRLWEELLGVQRIGVRHDFFEMGGHSLLVAQLMTRVEREFGQRLPLGVLFEDPTVEHLAAVLCRRQRAADVYPSMLVPITAADPSRKPLFFVHPAGGSVFCYGDLGALLGPDQPFYGLQAQGLDGKEEPYTRLEPMARHYLRLVKTVQPRGPYLLGGWSMGGVVAFEMARQLLTREEEVALLTMVDSHAPAGSREQGLSEASLLVGFALDLGLSPEWVSAQSAQLEQFAPEEGLRYLLERAQQTGIMSPGMDLGQVCILYKVFRANVMAVGRYVPDVYPGAITLFRAKGSPGETSLVEDLGWQGLAAEGLTVHAVPGDHFTVIRMPQVEVVAETLNALIRREEE